MRSRSMFPIDDPARILTYFGDGDLSTVLNRDKTVDCHRSMTLADSILTL